jgi:hypothetical protein
MVVILRQLLEVVGLVESPEQVDGLDGQNFDLFFVFLLRAGWTDDQVLKSIDFLKQRNYDVHEPNHKLFFVIGRPEAHRLDLGDFSQDLQTLRHIINSLACHRVLLLQRPSLDLLGG